MKTQTYTYDDIVQIAGKANLEEMNETFRLLTPEEANELDLKDRRSFSTIKSLIMKQIGNGPYLASFYYQLGEIGLYCFKMNGDNYVIVREHYVEKNDSFLVKVKPQRKLKKANRPTQKKIKARLKKMNPKVHQDGPWTAIGETQTGYIVLAQDGSTQELNKRYFVIVEDNTSKAA